MPLLFLHISKKKREVNAMRCMLCIQCAIRGLLTINGQFCGPVDGEGQTFPTARDAEIFIEYMPLTENAKPTGEGQPNRTRAARLRAHLAGRTDSA